MRTIDADELIKNDPFHRCHGKCNPWWDGYLKAANEAYVAVENAPTIDAVEVIRCGNCEYWNRDNISCEGLAKCVTGESGIRYRTKNDFCSKAQKRN